jgi:multiple sugar transport system substrate-binding protein
MKKSKKILAVLMSIAMMGTLLTGCGKDGTKDTSASDNGAKTTADGDASSDEQVTLSVVTWESDECNTAMQDAFDNVFSKDHPNIKVKVVDGSYSDYGSEIRSMIIAGEAPDVFQAGNDMAISYSQDGLTTDWTKYANGDSDFMSSFYSGSTDLWKLNDKVVGFPSLVNVYGVFYNKDILKQAGIAEPKTGWTWDELFKDAEALKDTASSKYGIYNFTLDAFHVSLMSQSEGGASFLDDIANPTKVTVDDKFKETVSKLAGYIADGTLPKTSYDMGDVLSKFENGEIGMLYYGQWEIDNLMRNKPDLNWGYVANPVGSTGKQCTIFDPVGWCSPSGLKHEKETWELIKFMSSDMYKTVLKATPVAASANKDASETFFSVLTDKGHSDAAEAVKTMMSSETKCGVRFLPTWSGDAGKLWNETYNNILDGVDGNTVDKLPELADSLNSLIADNQ